MLYFYYVSLFCCIAAILLHFLEYLRASWLLHCSHNMANSKHRLLKQILLRFTNCTKLDIPIRNTNAFVKRYIAHYSIFGIHYHTFSHLANFCILCSLLSTIYGTLFYEEVYGTYTLILLLVCITYLIFCNLLNLNTYHTLAMDYICDYLDNTIYHRFAQLSELAKEQPSTINEILQQEIHKTPTVLKKKSTITNADAIICSVLNEYL